METIKIIDILISPGRIFKVLLHVVSLLLFASLIHNIVVIDYSVAFIVVVGMYSALTLLLLRVKQLNYLNEVAKDYQKDIDSLLVANNEWRVKLEKTAKYLQNVIDEKERIEGQLKKENTAHEALKASWDNLTLAYNRTKQAHDLQVSELESLKSANDSQDKRIRSQQSEIDSLEDVLTTAKARTETQENTIKSQQSEIDSLNRELEAATIEKKSIQNRLNAYIGHAKKNNGK